VTPNLPSDATNLYRSTDRTRRFGKPSQHSDVDMGDGLVVPLASPRDLGCWVERNAASSEHFLLIGDTIFISATRLIDYSIRSIKLRYSSVGLASSRSSWSHPESSRPGLTRLLSSVTTSCAFSHENPAGRQSTSARLDRQEPYVNGLGGGAPGINVLCAWFRIYARESVANSKHGDQWPNLFYRGNIQ
jgi:hypothetical protein